MNDGHPLVPTSKSDLERARAAVAAGFPSVEPVLEELFVWLQDCNWPVAHVIAPFLARLGLVTVPHVRRVLQSNDDIWKYWVLTRVVAPQPEVAAAIHRELERIVREPSQGERKEGVLESAEELLRGHGAAQQ